MKLSQDNLHHFFEIASPFNSHYNEMVNTYDFISRKSKTLCVTIGESWTWGSALNDRVNDVYGSQLAAMLDADWLNLGLPGVGNHFIANKVVELNKLELEYDNIFVFCTFTEIGRRLNSQYDQHINFTDWKDSQLTLNFDNFLLMLNNDCVEIINNNSNNFTNTIIGSNFVNPLGFNDSTFWLDLLETTRNKTCYAALHGLYNLVTTIPELLNLSIDEKDQFKDWAAHLLDAGKERVQIMGKSDQFDGDHPKFRSGHEVWAKHLFDRL